MQQQEAKEHSGGAIAFLLLLLFHHLGTGAWGVGWFILKTSRGSSGAELGDIVRSGLASCVCACVCLGGLRMVQQCLRREIELGEFRVMS